MEIVSPRSVSCGNAGADRFAVADKDGHGVPLHQKQVAAPHLDEVRLVFCPGYLATETPHAVFDFGVAHAHPAISPGLITRVAAPLPAGGFSVHFNLIFR